MEHISKHLPQSIQQQAPVSYEEFEKVLTPDEIRSLLRQASESKLAAIRLAEYNKKLAEEKKAISVDAGKFYKWIVEKSQSGINGFALSKEEEKIYKLLSLYFTGDKRFEEQGYSLSKGIMLWGVYGCGKTTIMKNFMENPLALYGVVPCRRVAEIYSDEGSDIVWRYAKAESICFDDLGTEIEAGLKQHYGNKKNVMADVILNHYDTNQSKVFRMHFTTNLSMDEIEKYYGGRARSRLREMVNLISLEGITDKRK